MKVGGTRQPAGLLGAQRRRGLDTQRPLLLALLQTAYGTDAVHMALDQMAAQPILQTQGALEIDRVAGLEQAQGGPFQRFGHRFDDKRTPVQLHHGLAGAVDIDAIAYAGTFEYGLGRNFKALKSALAGDAMDGPDLFDYSSEHGYSTSAV